jgi:hypothetical protein
MSRFRGEEAMLKTLDLLIGVSVVMLIISMAVTMVTQLALGVFNGRAKALRAGIAGLMTQLDRDLTDGDAKAIAEMLLSHPLVADSCNCFRRAATVIHREELTQLLMHVAVPPAGAGTSATPQNQVHAMLTKGGIMDPGQTLDAIRKTSVALEKTNPDMAHDARVNAAILDQADSPIVAKINAWFDSTIDRVAARFTALARICSIGISVVLVVIIQLDVFMLLNHLATDDAARAAVVNQAMSLITTNPDDATRQAVNAALQGSGTLTLSDLHLDGLVSDNLIQIPGGFSDWWAQWSRTTALRHIAGMLVAMALLSLGGPFWYNVLKSLLQLRSAIADKDDAQRQVRQSQQTPAQPSSQPPPLIGEGEKGDLAATG